MHAIESTPMRQRVDRLESILENAPQADCPTRWHFAPGVACREMLVPQGVVATGAVHKTDHLTIVAGHCLLTTDEGVRELIGVNTVRSKPGAKRAIFAIETTVVMTVHATDETDPAKLVEMLTESRADELLGGPANRQLQAMGMLR